MVKVVRQVTDTGKRLEIALKNLEGKVAKVGWFEKSKYETGVSVAYVATIQEYGYPAKNIPPRPFMRPTIVKNENQWKKIAESGAKAVLNGNQTVANIMEAIGLKAAGDIRKTISLVWQPPLSPKTIQARLRKRADNKTVGNLTKPLIDTGIMLGTLTNTVEDE
jgi:hypothetical protein